MRILHTADWHLGTTFYGFSREYEHRKFFFWLSELIDEKKIEVLLIAGDIFDTANPSAVSQAMYYQFCSDLRKRFIDLEIVIIAGNHDSPLRLEAPKSLMKALNIHVVGSVDYLKTGELQAEKMIIPLKGKSKNVKMWCAAVPFLRPADLPKLLEESIKKEDEKEEKKDFLIEGVRLVYKSVLDEIRKRRKGDEAIIAMGHAYFSGTKISELSERKILGGNQHALPVDLFPDDVAYVALGHLHFPQTVGDKENVRYSGSPIPLAIDEGPYAHQVLVVDLESSNQVEVEPIKIPQFVRVLRFPVKGELLLEDLLEDLKELPDKNLDLPENEYPFIEIAVLLEKPEPALRRTIEEALEGKAVRICKISPVYSTDKSSYLEGFSKNDLDQLLPEEVFIKRYFKDYKEPPYPFVLENFHQLLELAYLEEVK